MQRIACSDQVIALTSVQEILRLDLFPANSPARPHFVVHICETIIAHSKTCENACLHCLTGSSALNPHTGSMRCTSTRLFLGMR